MLQWIFPRHPFMAEGVDDAFEEEFEILRDAGYPLALVDLGQLSARIHSLTPSKEAFSSKSVYRGWPLSPTDYQNARKASSFRAGMDSAT